MRCDLKRNAPDAAIALHSVLASDGRPSGLDHQQLLDFAHVTRVPSGLGRPKEAVVIAR